MTTIYFDMDGTIADLYNVTNWLAYLMAEDALPYEVAKPLLRLNILARTLNKLQREGYRIGIISWLSKSGSEEYGEKVAAAKLEWLKKHLPSVDFDEINIVPYGTSKNNYCGSPDDILFDDEEKNRQEWGGKAFDVENILKTLGSLK